MAIAADGVVAKKVNGQVDGQPLRKREQKRPAGFARWSLGVIVRLLIWYALLTPLFHCPSTPQELDSNSSWVCKPYLIARSHIEPHITPYYEFYGAPYVDTVRPYARTFNEKIYIPAVHFATRTYRMYGAAHFEKGTSYVRHQLGALITPHLYSLQNSTIRIYENSIGPYYTSVSTVVTPYYQASVTHFDKAWRSYVQPFYAQSKPVIVKASSSAYNIAVNTIYPYAKKIWSSLLIFINETLLPGIVGLYTENVEPQLVRIGEKLAGYREGRKLGAVVEETESSTKKFTSTVFASLPTTTVSPKTSAYSTTTYSSSAPHPEQSIDKVSLARETIATDLKTWQEKFAIAADKGVEDLDERVAKLVERRILDARKFGEELVSELETVGKQELKSLKAKINDILRGLPNESSVQDRDDAESQLVEAVRTAGFAIRGSAQKLRQWLRDFNRELFAEVAAVSDATVDVLDQIRDLGLQNIGMKWAWMDGVTYKDWAKYNALKKQFHSWREEVRVVGMKHSAYEDAKSLANEIVERGMAIAETTAKELTRLKEVGKWKIEAEDTSHDFETRTGDASEVRASRRAAMGLGAYHNSISAVETKTTSDTAEYPSSSAPEAEASETNPSDQDTPEPSHETDSTEPGPEPEPEPEPFVGDDNAGTGDNVWGGAAAELIEHEEVSRNSPEQASDGPSSQQQPLMTTLSSSSTTTNLTSPAEPSGQSTISTKTSSSFSDSISQAKKQYDRAHSVAGAHNSGTPDEHVIASIESAYPGSLQHASENLEPHLKAPSEYARIPITNAITIPSPTPPQDDGLLSIASAKLQSSLELASVALSKAIASATAAAADTDTDTGTKATVPGQQIILDARRRYYEAIGLAHDQYSIFLNSASDATSTSISTSIPSSVKPSETSIPALTSKPILEQASSEFSSVSSLASASLDALLYSIRSVSASIDPVSASSIIADASSRFQDALSAASALLVSASSATSCTPTSAIKDEL
ncbi:hypothetical protein GX48_07264 [Paracoccidioides brasiliensis]|nr:hypothetical protein GX48_07264 [Paracoccidioides brasiliensis]